jgi:hypothetical protein
VTAPVFEARGRAYGWTEILEAADVRSELAALRTDAARSLAASAAAHPGSVDISAAAQAWRRARGLLSGDELDAWLGARGLTLADLRAYLTGSILRERAAPDLDAVAPESVDAFLDVEGHCSGAYEEWARRLAARVALVGDAASAADREARFREHIARLSDEEALAAEVRANEQQWTRARVTYAAFAEAAAADESILCVREDGLPLTEVAAMAQVEAHEDEWFLEEVEPDLAAQLLAARPGEVLGPLESAGRHEVVVLSEKVAPTVDDPLVRERAADAVIARALDRAIDSEVRWC